LGWGAVDFY